ncbi:MAG: MFS transporter [Coxiellaceae bacterium]|nr:MFS transporter [Coxiellaceae bacterium]
MRAIDKSQRRKDAKMRLRRMRRVSHPPSPRRAMAWLVWGASAVFVLFQFSLQLSSGEIVQGLMNTFTLGALGAGVLASTYYYVYVLLQAPAGMIVDRYGPRKVLTIGALVCGIGTLVFGLSHWLLLAAVGRMMMGAGAAFAFVGSLYLVGKWFPVRKFSLMVGIAEAIGMAGSLLGGIYMANFVQNIGWQTVMILSSGIAALVAILLWSLVRDTPYQTKAPKSIRPKGSFRKDLRVLMHDKMAWYSGMYSGLMFGVVTVFISLWGIPYLQLAHHISLLTATTVANMLFIGVAIGSPLVGWLDARVNRRVLLVTTALASSVLVSLVIYLPGLPLVTLGGIMLILGISSSTYVIPFAIAHELATPFTRSAYMGFTNMLSVGSAPIFQPIVGLIITLAAMCFPSHGHGYSVLNYQIGLTIVPLMTIAAAVLARHLPLRSAPPLCEPAQEDQAHCEVKEKHTCAIA